MAFVRPLYYSSGNLVEMNDTQISQVRTRAKFLFMNNPSVYLTRVNSGGDLGNITDTRFRAGSATSDSTNFDTAAETPNIERVDVNYSRVEENVDNTSPPSDGSGYSFPLYYDSTGNLRAMSLQDIYDTFAENAILDLDGNGQLYTISTSSSVSGYTSLGIIFSDTGANVGSYTASGIPESIDQPFTRANYYLHKRNSGSQSYPVSLVRYNGSDIQQMSTSQLDSILESATRHLAAEVGGFRLRFSWNGSGTDTGTVNDTRLNGSGNYQTRQVGDDYRTQEFPNGSFRTANTYRLRVRRV